MEFYSSIADADFPKFEWGAESKMLFLGSCFTERVGSRLARIGMITDVNPLGIAFNPYSLCRLIQLSLKDSIPEEDEFVQNNELWHHFDYHGDFSNTSVDSAIESIQEASGKLKLFLRDADVIFLSLGTAYAFRHAGSNQIVSNCHKVDASEFNRELIPLEDIVDVMNDTLSQIKAVNPSCTVVLTVSPVKHLRDGLVSNRRSKSILIEACHRICEDLGTHYFPSYELLVDQLRDYRFYDDDLAHPALVTVEIIYQKFLQQFFSESARTTVNRLEKVRNFIDHQPFDRESKAHRSAIEKQVYQLESIQADHPELRTQELMDLLSSSTPKV